MYIHISSNSGKGYKTQIITEIVIFWHSPPTPSSNSEFWAAPSHFLADFDEKGVKMLSATFCFIWDEALRNLKHDLFLPLYSPPLSTVNGFFDLKSGLDFTLCTHRIQGWVRRVIHQSLMESTDFSNLNFINIPKINRSTRPSHYKACWSSWKSTGQDRRTDSKIDSCSNIHIPAPKSIK